MNIKSSKRNEADEIAERPSGCQEFKSPISKEVDDKRTRVLGQGHQDNIIKKTDDTPKNEEGNSSQRNRNIPSSSNHLNNDKSSDKKFFELLKEDYKRKEFNDKRWNLVFAYLWQQG